MNALGTLHREAAVADSRASTGTTSSPPQAYTFSLPNATIIEPTVTSQGMIVSSIIPRYEICDTPGSNTTSCSTIFETVTTSYCSTVLTYALTQTTISDCTQNITFSTQSSCSLATATITPSVTLTPRKRQAATSSPSVTTYIQTVTSYYVAPWQSLVAGPPSNVTVLICQSDYAGNETCTTVQEVWVVQTEYVSVLSTSTLVISTSLASVSLLSPIS